MTEKLGPFEPHSAWYYSTDGGETYHGGSATKEGAIQEGRDDDPDSPFTVAQCHTHVLKLSDFFDAEDWLDGVNDGPTDDDTGEDGDPIFDPPKEAKADLQVMVREAIDAWQVKHGLRFKSYWFWECCDEEAISPVDPDAI